MYGDAVRYRSIVGLGLVLGVVLGACGKDGASTTQGAQRPPPPPARDAAAATSPADAEAFAPDTYRDLGEALVAIIPADARVLGFGELHSRTDRAAVRSALSRFTEALPRIGDQLSDLVVETWVVDPKCGQAAVTATRQLETTVKRPEATKSEITLLADAARAAKIQPHAMTLTCADYKTLVQGGEPDPVAMLTLTTRELTRIATSAIVHRDKEPAHRPWIAVYGGALHNDAEPAPGVAEWSYAAALDKATGDKFVELDLIVPELAAADATSRQQPWFPLVERAGDRIQVHARNPRSFVIVLPKTR